jgi:hypothetical protein
VKGIGTGIALALALAGCTSKIDWDSFRLPSLGENLRLPSMTAPVPVDVRGPVKAEDLVDSEGRCAGAPMASAAPAAEGADPVTVPPDAALAASGIGLAMTECDVVKRAGPPEKLELGSNERSERALTLSYLKGPRPGIYRFVEGRLVMIERAPEPPAPPKPVRPAKPAKPKPKVSAT